jgi:hypothetical protein
LDEVEGEGDIEVSEALLRMEADVFRVVTDEPDRTSRTGRSSRSSYPSRKMGLAMSAGSQKQSLG